jgi:hypothetical protein
MINAPAESNASPADNVLPLISGTVCSAPACAWPSIAKINATTPSPYHVARTMSDFISVSSLTLDYFERIRDRMINAPAESNASPADNVLPLISGTT